MSETSALRPGQKVTLPAWVKSTGLERAWIEFGGIAYVAADSNEINVPLSALTPVVEPEPVWSPGDVVRIDGVNHMVRGTRCDRWIPCDEAGAPVRPQDFSQRWAEGRVVVVYRKEADK